MVCTSERYRGKGKEALGNQSCSGEKVHPQEGAGSEKRGEAKGPHHSLPKALSPEVSAGSGQFGPVAAAGVKSSPPYSLPLALRLTSEAPPRDDVTTVACRSRPAGRYPRPYHLRWSLGMALRGLLSCPLSLILGEQLLIESDENILKTSLSTVIVY